ncbi:MAG: GNAT family N-acetyltransferase [Sandaracinaceae bacterium]|nr:GNAT family N-acetyltransferase [Sandaracinaceae bacterium]
MRVHLSGHIDIPLTRLEEVLAELPRHVALTRAEPGNQRFVVTPAEQPAGRLWVEETFRDRAALEVHQARGRASAWGRVTAGIPRHFFLVRHAARRDRDTLAELYLTCRRQTFTWVDPERYALDDFDGDTEDELLLVCERDDRPVGFAGFWAQDDFLHHLFVSREHQGHGAGLGLLRTVQRYATGPLRLKCAVQNQRALGFYERLGGVIEATNPPGPEGPSHTIVLPQPE